MLSSVTKVLLLVAALQLTHHQCGAQSAPEAEPVLEEASVPVPAPEPAPEPLPVPDRSECTAAVFHEATSKSHTCGEIMYSYKDPEEECCVPLREYYDVNSTKPSANCFCNDAYWARLLELEEYTYMQLETHLIFCNIPYYQDGVGPCAGLPVAAEEGAAEEGAESAEATVEPHTRSFGKWVRDLKGDHLMMFTFVMGLISVVGFFALLWPLVTDTVLEIYKVVTLHKARRASA